MPKNRETECAIEKARAKDRKARVRRLDRPVVVGVFPTANFSERKDAAVNERLTEIFAAYDVDPYGAHSWEMLAWRLAVDLFPKFEVVNLPARAPGKPNTRKKMRELLDLFEAYRPTAKSRQNGVGSRYKHFLSEHKAKCAACKITTEGSLKSAVSVAKQLRAKEKSQEEALVRFETIRALGLFGYPKSSESSV